MAIEDDKRKQRIKDIEAELEGRTRKTKVYIALEKEVIKLKNEEKKVQEDINKGLELGVRANKAFAKITSDAKKAEEDLNRSLSDRLQSLVKGNVAQAVGLDGSKKAKELTRDLTKETKSQASFVLNDSKASAANKLKLLSITEDVASGVSSEAEAQERVKALGLKQKGLSADMQKRVSNIAGLQKESALHVGKSSARMAKFAKYGAVAGVVVGFMVKAITQFAAKIDEVGKTFGFLTSKNEQFRNDLIDAGNEAILIGKGLGDVLAVTSQLSSEFGITLTEADDLSRKVLDTAVATGLSNDEATKLFGTFMQIGDLTAKQAEDLIENTAQLAAQRGVAPTAVLQDMAGSAEEIAKFTKGSGNNIAEAAIQARQLGLSLQTTAKISEGLLDFESSIRAEVEASVMTGRRLNFQKARQLSLDGDLAGATKEVVKQLGSEEELNKLNVLQRQSIAKSIGVSVVELNKLVRGQDKLTLSTALAGKKFDDLVGQDSLSTLTSIINGIKSIGATLLDTLGRPINNLIEKFRDTISGPEGLARTRKFFVSFGNVIIGLVNILGNLADMFIRGNAFTSIDPKEVFGTPTNDFRGGRGAITTMAGPAGVFRLNPMDSVMATTNPIPVNDFSSGPAGSMGGTQKIEVTGQLTGTRGALMATIESPLG